MSALLLLWLPLHPIMISFQGSQTFNSHFENSRDKILKAVLLNWFPTLDCSPPRLLNSFSRIPSWKKSKAPPQSRLRLQFWFDGIVIWNSMLKDEVGSGKKVREAPRVSHPNPFCTNFVPKDFSASNIVFRLQNPSMANCDSLSRVAVWQIQWRWVFR